MFGKCAVTALLCSSCVIDNYGAKRYVGAPARTLEGSAREVVVGDRYQLHPSGGVDLDFGVSAAPLCRSALFGDRVARQDWERPRRSGLAVAELTVGSIALITGMSLLMVGLMDSTKADPAVGAAIGVPGLYFGGLGYSRILDADRMSGTDEVGRDRNITEWASDVHVCEKPQMGWLAPRTLRVEVAFAGGSYSQIVTSDARGNATISGFMRDAMRVAAECGEGTLTITDESQDDNDDPGSPEKPHLLAFRAEPASRAISGAGAQPLSSLPDDERSVAERCHADRAAACAAKVGDDLLPGCMDSCARLVDATRCVLAVRHCRESAPNDDQCLDDYTTCLEYVGVDEDDLDQCTKRCITAARQEECQ